MTIEQIESYIGLELLERWEQTRGNHASSYKTTIKGENE